MTGLATVGWDDFVPVYNLRPWLEAVVGTVFLLAAIRMHQAAPHRSSRLMGLGFGCLVVAKLYEGALQLGMIKMNYFPGYDHGWIGSPFFPEVEMAWWEPVIWWGQCGVGLAGWGLAAAGFLSAGRRIVREARHEPFQRPATEGGDV